MSSSQEGASASEVSQKENGPCSSPPPRFSRRSRSGRVLMFCASISFNAFTSSSDMCTSLAKFSLSFLMFSLTTVISRMAVSASCKPILTLLMHASRLPMSSFIIDNSARFLFHSCVIVSSSARAPSQFAGAFFITSSSRRHSCSCASRCCKASSKARFLAKMSCSALSSFSFNFLCSASHWSTIASLALACLAAFSASSSAFLCTSISSDKHSMYPLKVSCCCRLCSSCSAVRCSASWAPSSRRPRSFRVDSSVPTLFLKSLILDSGTHGGCLRFPDSTCCVCRFSSSSVSLRPSVDRAWMYPE
mmetsp:Transcript_3464/g.10029  ORF Transcript_3464/g.10029 Transcript_3464/m.10029 type:complete len:305 (-) Transcript_3464:1852-2766(-)